MKGLQNILIKYLEANHQTVSELLKLSKHKGDEIDRLTTKMLNDERMLQELGEMLGQFIIRIK